VIERGSVKRAFFALLASVIVGSALGESTEPTTIRITTRNLEWLNVTTADNVICIGANVGGADVSNTSWIGNVYGVTSARTLRITWCEVEQLERNT
jgi:hypothetical protein